MPALSPAPCSRSSFRRCWAVIALHQRTARLVEDSSRDLLQRPRVVMNDKGAVCVDEFASEVRIGAPKPSQEPLAVTDPPTSFE
jgi:hypothetical protein